MSIIHYKHEYIDIRRYFIKLLKCSMTANQNNYYRNYSVKNDNQKCILLRVKSLILGLKYKLAYAENENKIENNLSTYNQAQMHRKMY